MLMDQFERFGIDELYGLVLNRKTNSSTVKEFAAIYTNPQSLIQTSILELQKIQGIGKARAKQILAMIELSKRMLNTNKDNTATCTSPQDVASLLAQEMQFLDREHFRVIALNTKNKVINIETVSVGSLNSTIVHPREIFKNAIKLSAAAMILVHNHPSGVSTASIEDIEVTKRLVEVGKLVGINVLDHVIIGDGNFFSFKEKGLIQ